MKKLRLNFNLWDLREMYHDRNMSLEDIAKHYNCSRVNIYYMFKKFNISLRTKSESRELTYKENKIKINRQYNSDLFKSWTPKMAYLLGLLYTDGNISYHQGKNKIYKRFSFSQTDKQFFYKVCDLFSFSGKTYQDSKSLCNTMMICNTEMVNDLEKIGLHPRKSFTIEFPQNIPDDCLSHFIRGIFDGDGCKTPCKVTIVSASYNFLKSISDILYNSYNIKNKIYSYKYHTLTIGKKSEIKKFHDFIYYNKDDMYFEKKYHKFIFPEKIKTEKIILLKGRKIGEKHPKFSGYYIVPDGTRYSSSYEAERSTGVYAKKIWRYCHENKNGYSFEKI